MLAKTTEGGWFYGGPHKGLVFEEGTRSDIFFPKSLPDPGRRLFFEWRLFQGQEYSIVCIPQQPGGVHRFDWDYYPEICCTEHTKMASGDLYNVPFNQ